MNYKHGQTNKHPLYKTWKQMRQRCNNPNDEHYKFYGARGIKVCARWDNFENFVADMGERPIGATLDRKDNNKGYSPENCKWSTKQEQANNRKNSYTFTFEGLTKTVYEWARFLGLTNPKLFSSRLLDRNWDFVKAATTPKRKYS